MKIREQDVEDNLDLGLTALERAANGDDLAWITAAGWFALATWQLELIEAGY